MCAAAYRGRAFLYVLVAAGPEDLLKVGMTHDPLSRWSAFHPRWYESFDLERSLLVETETRADARALETDLHRRLRPHRCPQPMGMRLAAGGATEWYRGAWAQAFAYVDERGCAGFVVHRDARPVLAPAMARAADRLDALVAEAARRLHAGWLGAAERQAIRDLVAAHRVFGLDVEAMFAAEVRDALGLG